MGSFFEGFSYFVWGRPRRAPRAPALVKVFLAVFSLLLSTSAEGASLNAETSRNLARSVSFCFSSGQAKISLAPKGFVGGRIGKTKPSKITSAILGLWVRVA
jgi:hypothetical protein